MAYFDRLSQALYVSPGGSSFSFSFQAVTREVSHRVGSFEFAGVNGTLHQDKGVGGEIYPLTIYFAGQDYDEVADAFFSATKETGIGTLTHPRWGSKRVQIIKCTQQENLIAGAAQAVFNVDFQESLEEEFPVVSDYLNFEVLNLANAFELAEIANFIEEVVTTTASIRLEFKETLLAATSLVNDSLSSLVSNDQDIAATFNNYISDIEDNINDYTEDPEGFVTSIIGAIRIVSTVEGQIDSKLSSYSTLIDAVSAADITDKNSLLVNEAVGVTAVVAVSESINTAFANTATIQRGPTGEAITFVPQGGTGFQTRGEVLSSVVLLRDSFNAMTFSLDDGQTAFNDLKLSESYLQTVASYESAAAVVTKTIEAGLGLSFSLPAQRSFTLKTDSTVIHQCWDLYSNIDDTTLDFFIFTNSLPGEQILLLPRGREVIYYA